MALILNIFVQCNGGTESEGFDHLPYIVYPISIGHPYFDDDCNALPYN